MLKTLQLPQLQQLRWDSLHHQCLPTTLTMTETAFQTDPPLHQTQPCLTTCQMKTEWNGTGLTHPWIQIHPTPHPQDPNLSAEICQAWVDQDHITRGHLYAAPATKTLPYPRTKAAAEAPDSSE